MNFNINTYNLGSTIFISQYYTMNNLPTLTCRNTDSNNLETLKEYLIQIHFILINVTKYILEYSQLIIILKTEITANHYTFQWLKVSKFKFLITHYQSHQFTFKSVVKYLLDTWVVFKIQTFFTGKITIKMLYKYLNNKQ